MQDANIKMREAKVQHASQVVVMPIESYVTPPSPSPMLEAV